MENLLKTAERFLGAQPKVEALIGAGSGRKYYRLFHDGKSYIGVEGQSVEENEAFFYLAKHLGTQGKTVPEVLAVSDDKMAYIQTDLGDISLYDLLMEGNPALPSLISRVVVDLAKIEVEGADGVDPDRFFCIKRMDKRSIMWDLNYFKYSFLKCTPIQFEEPKLEDDFEKMADYLCTLDGKYLMYRDFQSRNMMITNDVPYYIDFQGARLGPLGYDIVSFLYQAKANFSNEVRQRYLKSYLEALSKYDIDIQKVAESIPTFVLFRTLQVLGAYGYRGFFEKKIHFLQSIAPALHNLAEIVARKYPFECEYLLSICRKLSDLAPQYSYRLPENLLTVTVTSFSYMKGLPEDYSGNGGGFVFDCRAIHNPGREARFRPRTGMDQDVIDFLETQSEMPEFMVNVNAIVNASVAKYLQRGFNHLMVSFGCTGGRHRSVYAAEHCAAFIRENYPNVRVILNHREQNVKKIFEVEAK